MLSRYWIYRLFGQLRWSREIIHIFSWKKTLMFFFSNTIRASSFKLYVITVLLLGCGNPTRHIYRLHKWKVSAPVHPQKMRMAGIFQLLMQPLFFLSFFFFFCQHYNQALSVWRSMAGQLLIAQPMIAIVLGKATNFHCGLNGHRADNMKPVSYTHLTLPTRRTV